VSRLTITIPASRAAAVNAALAAIAPEAAGTFHMNPALDAEGTPDTSVMVASWDLGATGHERLAAVIAKAVEDTGRTGTGRTAKTAEIRVGDDPTAARIIAAADLTGERI
jgi:hypothetical protein